MKRAAPEKNATAADAIAVGQTSVICAADSQNVSDFVIAVRVSPTGYLAALFLFSLIAGFLFYLNQSIAGSLLLAAVWLTLPPLAWFDRVKFDGQALSRTGFLPRLWNKLLRQPQRLKLADIEHIETQAIRALRSGGRVFYRYRCEVRGGDQFFAFASGGAAFRQFVRALFSVVVEDKLDARSLELRDYLASTKETEKIINKLQLPSADVAENALKTVRVNDKMRQIKRSLWHSEHRQSETAEHLHLLRQVANQLRLGGNLAQSLEAFRRALFVAPADGWLLLEFSRGLHSYASAARQKQLMRRAFAALRLAVRHGFDNARLLVRIGESYFQFGDYAAAEKVFRRALEIEKDNFRALHGLAEVALSEGKLAHVAHNYQAAAGSAVADEALKQWAQNEAEYFTLLNLDENYMEAELTRINWLHSADRGSRICLRLTIVGLATVLMGTFFDAQIAQIGLAIAGATAILWLLLSFAVGILAARSPVDEDEED
jgi:tetratricopeptide (TPR) repeat protein